MAAKLGNLEAMFNIALGLQDNGGDEKALPRYIKGANAGEINCQYILAGFYKVGGMVELDPDKSFELYLKVAEKSMRDEEIQVDSTQMAGESQYYVAEAYKYGLGVTGSATLALKWYMESAKLCHTQAQITLGMMYKEGSDVLPPDVERVIYWLRNAASEMRNSSGNSLDQYHLAKLLSDHK